MFLDDVTTQAVEEALNVRLVPVEQDGGALLDALFEVDWDDGGAVEWVPCGEDDGDSDDDAYEEYPTGRMTPPPGKNTTVITRRAGGARNRRVNRDETLSCDRRPAQRGQIHAVR